MYGLDRNAIMRLAQAAAQKMGLNKSKARPHELILALPLSNDVDTYTFSLHKETAEKYLPAITKGLEDRNAFIAIGGAVGILPVPVIGGKEYPTAASIEYHPDLNVFNFAATNILSEQQALESIYYGKMNLKTNEGVRLDKMPMLHFRTVNQTQKTATTANQFNGNEVKAFGAAIRFGGGDDNEVSIAIKCSDKTDIAGDPAVRKNYLIVRLVGTIVRGSTTRTYTS